MTPEAFWNTAPQEVRERLALATMTNPRLTAHAYGTCDLEWKYLPLVKKKKITVGIYRMAMKKHFAVTIKEEHDYNLQAQRSTGKVS